MLLALTGCGGNKIVATKTTDADNSMLGAYTEKIEITFKKDKADKIVWTTEFEDESNASKMAGLYKLAGSEIGDIKVEQKGKKVIMTMDAKAFASESDLDEDALTKDELTKSLEEQGYKVK